MSNIGSMDLFGDGERDAQARQVRKLNFQTRSKAVGKDFKGKVSVVFYAVAIPLSFVNSWLACALYVRVAVMWLIPDRRIELALAKPTA